MKFDELIIITESYKDFKMAIRNAMDSLAEYNSTSTQVRDLISNGTADQFKEYVSNNWISGRERDVGHWISMLNDNPSELRSLRRFLSQIDEDRVPDYTEMRGNNGLVFFQLDNFAASKKFCKDTNWCIVSNERDFESYKKDGALVAVWSSAGKFIFEWNKFNQDFSIWEGANNEIDPDEFASMAGIRSRIRLTSPGTIEVKRMLDLLNADLDY
jgi:hypothetical protein